MDYIDYFKNKPRLVFLTIHPNKGMKIVANTKISKWRGILKTMSDDFLIVREETGGYHFHAILSLLKDTQLRYIKNVHFKYISITNKQYVPENKFEDTCEAIGSITDISDEVRDELLEKVVQERKERLNSRAKQRQPILRDKKYNSVSRVIRYMLKDNPTGFDQILFIKNRKLAVVACGLEVEADLLPQEVSKSDDISIEHGTETTPQ